MLARLSSRIATITFAAVAALAPMGCNRAPNNPNDDRVDVRVNKPVLPKDKAVDVEVKPNGGVDVDVNRDALRDRIDDRKERVEERRDERKEIRDERPATK